MTGPYQKWMNDPGGMTQFGGEDGFAYGWGNIFNYTQKKQDEDVEGWW